MTEIITWLLTPISGAALHHIPPWTAWHARLMVAAWGVLLPLGVLIARFYKVLPSQDWPRVLDNKLWWHAHRTFQYLGVLLMSVGAFIAWSNADGGSGNAVWHARVGWAVIALGLLQVVAGALRGSKGGPLNSDVRGDHYDMTPRRIAFEWTHKAGGYLALVLAVLAMVLGLGLTDAPRWMWIVLSGWWLALLVAAFLLQRQGRCIDTYQAIWGPDTATAASRRPPVGWGVRRYSSEQWRKKFHPMVDPSDRSIF